MANELKGETIIFQQASQIIFLFIETSSKLKMLLKCY